MRGRSLRGVAICRGVECGRVGRRAALPDLGSGPPPDLYVLSPKSTFPEDLPTVEWQLVVEEPSTAKGIDTDRIAIAPSALEVKYLAGSRWADRAPRMVQQLLIQSFENSKKIVSVGRQSIGLRSDYVLKVELREFQAEKTAEGGTVAHVRVNHEAGACGARTNRGVGKLRYLRSLRTARACPTSCRRSTTPSVRC